jgi:trigger factor
LSQQWGGASTVKVSAHEAEQRQMVLEIEVDDERVQRALDQAYKRIVSRINVPGFRKGRAPRPLVERMVGREALFEDAVEHLVPQVYQDALKEQQITPAGQPALEVTSTEPLQFKATVPLEPSVTLGDYRSVKVEREPIVVEDQEVDDIIARMREAYATWAPVERAAQIGDRAGLDVQATRLGRTIIDSKDAEFILDPGGAEPIPGFSDQLVGMTADQERTFSLGGEASEEAEAPPATEFAVRLHWVKERELPELDDEFARTAGEKETLDELRQEIRDQIRRHKEAEAEAGYQGSAVSQAVDGASVVIPPQLVEREAQHRAEDLRSTLDKRGIGLEQYLRVTGKDEETFRSELLAEAEQTLKRSLVLEAVADAEGLEIDEAEVREEIQQALQGASDPARMVRQALARPETRARVEAVLKSRKAVGRLVELSGGAPPPASADEPPPSSDDAPSTSEEAPPTSGEHDA